MLSLGQKKTCWGRQNIAATHCDSWLSLDYRNQLECTPTGIIIMYDLFFWFFNLGNILHQIFTTYLYINMLTLTPLATLPPPKKKKVAVLPSPALSNFWKFWKKCLVYKNPYFTNFSFWFFFPVRFLTLSKTTKMHFKQFFGISNAYVFIFSENN